MIHVKISKKLAQEHKIHFGQIGVIKIFMLMWLIYEIQVMNPCWNWTLVG